MPEYNIGFSEQLLNAANIVTRDSQDTLDGQRTILYLSLLSSEIALKALLERAGVPVRDIRRFSHSHEELLKKVDHCEVKVAVSPSQMRWLSASRIRAISVSTEYSDSTVGALFSLKDEKVSQYPNQIRYGNMITHAPAIVMLQASDKLLEWIKYYFEYIRWPRRDKEPSPQKSKGRFGRKRDTHLAAVIFCEAYGDGLSVGDVLMQLPASQSNSRQTYWIGHELLDHKGERCGRISAEYTYGSIGAYAEICIHDEIIEQESFNCRGISFRDKKNNEQPRELKYLLIKLADRAARKFRGRV